jgi:hypothetical protein
MYHPQKVDLHIRLTSEETNDWPILHQIVSITADSVHLRRTADKQRSKKGKTTYKRGQPVVERDKLVSGKVSFKKHYYFFTPR